MFLICHRSDKSPNFVLGTKLILRGREGIIEAGLNEGSKLGNNSR